MTSTVEQTQSDLLRLIRLAQKGEEVVIVNEGRPLATLTPLPESRREPNRQIWLAKLADLRSRIATDKTGLTAEQILDEDRGD
jgi:antitoxin (DNA-binding transcriptional repressor) of toxin-antitoxin stability system